MCLRDFSEMARGRRRNEVYTGFDANFEMDTALATPGVVGQALQRGPARPTSADAMDITALFIESLRALKFKVVSTFEDWWRFLPEQPEERITWGGNIFGRERKSSIGFLIADRARSQHRVVALRPQAPNVSFGSCGFLVDGDYPREASAIPAVPHEGVHRLGPIGFRSVQPPHLGIAREPVHRHVDGDVENPLHTGHAYDCAGDSKEAELRKHAERDGAAHLRAAAGPTERLAHVGAPAHDQKREKHALAEHVLRHMRNGGWGASYPVAPRECMPFLVEDGRRVICAKQIRAEAFDYFENILAKPPAQHMESYMELERRLAAEPGSCLTPDSTLSVSDRAGKRSHETQKNMWIGSGANYQR